MATTAIQSRTANIVVPSIHLGSFSPYPAISPDIKHPLRFTEDNTVPVFRDEMTSSYSRQPRSPAQWRSNNASYQTTAPYTYNAYSANRTSSYAPTTTPPLTPPPTGPRYPAAGISGQSPTLPVQPPNSPAQMPGPPREVCVECMMRDEDMADVDVTSPGVWERESDVLYHELCQHEEEEERERERGQTAHPSTDSGVSSTAEGPRPRAHGAKLTEGNLRVWLTLNPREPASKQQTLHLYLDSQNALLLAHNQARLQAMKESRQLDDKMRDAYSELRRSAYDLGASASALDDSGVKIRSPSASGFGDDARHGHRRDTTLLENGMIVERVDVRKEEARMRKEERRARKASRDSLSIVDPRDRERDNTSLYSFQAAEGTASLRAPAPYDSTMSVGLPTSRSVRSMFTTPSSPWQPTSSRPLSMAPVSGSSVAFASQTSLDSAASPRRRFFGMRQWSDYFGSNTSLAQSGSMVDMHLALDQDKHLPQAAHVDIGSNAPSLRDAWPHMEFGMAPSRPSLDGASSTTDAKKKKRRGFGRLWKIITGTPNKPRQLTEEAQGPIHGEDDEDYPLTPPPPLSYLVNRGSAQSDRSMSMMGTGRHVSMPSLTTSNGVHHPRSSSVPNGTAIGLDSPSDLSSTLPSPTEIRFPRHNSSGDEREDGVYDEDADAAVKKRGGSGISPPRPSFVINISEPDFRSTPPMPTPIPSPPPQMPMTRTGQSSSSLVLTIKSPSTPPLNAISFEKSLPPLPPGENESPAGNLLSGRSRSFGAPAVTFPVTTNPAHVHRGLSAPNPGFRSDDVMRRQSFNGLASRPALPRGAGPGTIPGLQCDEFGSSRHSLAVFQPVPNVTSKRKLRFGLGALLGRKEKGPGDHRRYVSAMTLPGSRSLSYEVFPGYAGAPSVSERSSNHGMSASSRRALDELVPQEPDFVAYRYPSRDERLDLSRT